MKIIKLLTVILLLMASYFELAGTVLKEPDLDPQQQLDEYRQGRKELKHMLTRLKKERDQFLYNWGYTSLEQAASKIALAERELARYEKSINELQEQLKPQ